MSIDPTPSPSIARPTTPPRGWNSWDSFGPAVTEDEVLANARFMSEHMLEFGWDTIVVDIQWYEPAARAGGYNDDADVVLDEYGRPAPTINRFPSAADGLGFRPLADAVHALGLKFGLHIMRGVPRRATAAALPLLGTDSTIADIADPDDPCQWNTDNWGINWSHPDATAYYRSLAELFAGWTVDFVKADDMIYPYHARDVEVMSAALAGTDRDIVLSLSPGIGDTVPANLTVPLEAHVAAHATMWRISGDLWDRWDDIYEQFARMARWAPVSTIGAWADADMLPLGHIGIRAERGDDRMSLLTAAEQRTMMTLWSIARSPLMVGGDLPTSDADTIALLTNAAVLDVNAHATDSRQVLRDYQHIVWTATVNDDAVVAVFAIGDAIDVNVDLGSLGLGEVASGSDLWSGEQVAVDAGQLHVRLGAHDAQLVRFAS